MRREIKVKGTVGEGRERGAQRQDWTERARTEEESMEERKGVLKALHGREHLVSVEKDGNIASHPARLIKPWAIKLRVHGPDSFIICFHKDIKKKYFLNASSLFLRRKPALPLLSLSRSPALYAFLLSSFWGTFVAPEKYRGASQGASDGGGVGRRLLASVNLSSFFRSFIFDSLSHANNHISCFTRSPMHFSRHPRTQVAKGERTLV